MSPPSASRKNAQQAIIIKRVKKGGHGGHHGGAWKIAYADFVTAMMAFFLLMWLLGSTAQGDLEGIADYFQNPLKVAMQGGEGTGDSSSIIQGGGEDLSRKVGQVRRGDTPNTRSINIDAAPSRAKHGADGAVEAAARRERAQLIDLKGKLEAIIEANPTLRQFKNQILLDIIKDGLRIQLIDAQNRPMFTTASAELRPYKRELLREIAKALNDVENRLSMSGHTDSAQYAGGERGFSNWELSSNRANAARRELVAGGLESGKMVRVVGLADTEHLVLDNPLDPANRRISIVVLNRAAEEAIRTQGSRAAIEVDSAPGFESVFPDASGAEAAQAGGGPPSGAMLR